MEQKKICMVGAFAVGKTSLVQRFCHGIFSEKYFTTLGVKIDKAVAETSAGPVSLILWDLAGEDAFHSLQLSYLSGAHGLIYVVDTTRRATVEVAAGLRKKVEETMGRVPSLVLANKCDLPGEVTPAELAVFTGLPVHLASAKTGESVRESFQELAGVLLSTREIRLGRSSP